VGWVRRIGAGAAASGGRGAGMGNATADATNTNSEKIAISFFNKPCTLYTMVREAYACETGCRTNLSVWTGRHMMNAHSRALPIILLYKFSEI
jgi:hypothetical protein